MSVFDPSVVAQMGSELFRLKLKPELKELYLFSLLFSFAFSLVTIFEPVFFYQEGYSLTFIALYYAMHYGLYIILLPLGGMFSSRFGVERGIALSLPIFILYFITLAAIPSNHYLIYAAVILLTLHKTLYWPSFHSDFAKFGDAKNRGTELSWMTFLRSGVGILGPLLGGFIVAFFGFQILFIIAAFLVLLSALPLLQTRERFNIRRTGYFDPWKLMKLRIHRRMVISMAAWGENLIDMVMWPIFLFIVLGSTEQLGILTSATIAIMTVFGFFVGELADRFSRRSLVRLHVPFMMVGHLLRPFAITPLRIFLTDALARMAFIGVQVPTLFRLYILSRRTSTITYMVAVEMALAIAKCLTALVLAAVFASMLPFQGFWVTFSIAALLALLYGVL